MKYGSSQQLLDTIGWTSEALDQEYTEFDDDIYPCDDIYPSCDDDEYQQFEEQPQLQKQIHKNRISNGECFICLEEDIQNLITIKGCGHQICRQCLTNYLCFKIKESELDGYQFSELVCEQKKIGKLLIGSTFGIRCPAKACTRVLILKEINQFLNETKITEFHTVKNRLLEQEERIKSLKAEAHRKRVVAEQQLEQLRKCPRCNEAKKLVNIKRKRIQCQNCGCPFCKDCYQKHAPSESCAEYQRKSEERRRKQEEERIRLLEQTKKLLDEGGDHLVHCPLCSALTVRISGCKYMTCQCGQNFCNICGCFLDHSKHFSHFKGAPFGNECLGERDASKISPPINTSQKRRGG